MYLDLRLLKLKFMIPQVAYPDAAPIMLMSEASVRDLNSRLDHEVTVSQFRPSIVVNDCEAFTEVIQYSKACKHTHTLWPLF